VEQQGYKEEAQGRQHQGERVERPRNPSGSAAAHPTDSSTLLSCPFCPQHHSTALPSLKRYQMRYEVESSWTREAREKAEAG